MGAEVERRQAKPRRPLRGHWLHRRDFFCTCHLTEGNWKATAPVRSISSRLLPPGCFLQVRSHGMRWGWCGEIEWVKMDDRAQGGFLKPCYTTNDRLPGSNSSSQVVVWLAVCWRSQPELALSPRGPRSCSAPSAQPRRGVTCGCWGAMGAIGKPYGGSWAALIAGFGCMSVEMAVG